MWHSAPVLGGGARRSVGVLKKYPWQSAPPHTPTTQSPTPRRPAVNQVENGSTCEAARRNLIMSGREARHGIHKPPRGVTRDWVPLKLQRADGQKPKKTYHSAPVFGGLGEEKKKSPSGTCRAGVLVNGWSTTVRPCSSPEHKLPVKLYRVKSEPQVHSF